MFSSKRLSFGDIKGKVESATHEFNSGWRNITDKAKKEVKIVNKKARKVLELEDGGSLREDHIMTVNLDTSHNLFKRFQNNWAVMHDNSLINMKKADSAEDMVTVFAKDYQKCSQHLYEFQANLLGLPDLLARVEIAQSRIDNIGQQVKQIEGLLVEYEDTCERLELEKQKVELKVKLSQLVETKHAEYTLKKSIVYGTTKSKTRGDEGTRLVASPTSVNTKEYEKQNSLEKQKAYQDAFLDQMNQYIKYGELEKPIAGSANEFNTDHDDGNIEIGELDLSTLREFLGPEEINSVLQASASQSKGSIAPSDDNSNSDVKDLTVSCTEKNEPSIQERSVVVDIARDIEPCSEKKNSDSGDEFFDTASASEND